MVELMKMAQDPPNTGITEDCRETYTEPEDPYCEQCKGIAININATMIECCDRAKNSIYCRICSTKMIIQKKKCPHFLCHMETTESLVNHVSG